MEYQMLKSEEINRELFLYFERHQVVKECWRKVNGIWIIKEAPFIDQWAEEDYKILIQCLKQTIQTKGVVFGAFLDGKLKGFSSVESTLFGKHREYLDLSCIHVSEDMRGHGIGKQLFQEDIAWAKTNGAKKLYISAHSAVETQAFYKNLGCKEAMEYNLEHVKREPYDCQMEYIL